MSRTETDAQSGVVGSVSKPALPTALSTGLDEYKFNYPRRGKAVIINNRYFDASTKQKEREGSEVDTQKVVQTFLDLGFDIEHHENLTGTDMIMNLKRVAMEDHSDADCFVCVIMSHGEEGRIYGTDRRVMIDQLTSNFKGDMCESLAGKPKLFFIQACRGAKFDWGTEIAYDNVDEVDNPMDGPSVRKIPLEADVLMAYSVVPGYFSWRNNVDGSWYIQALCQVLEKYGTSMELLHMLTLVNKIVAYDFQSCTDDDFTSNMKQSPCIASTLTKLVYFRPKNV